MPAGGWRSDAARRNCIFTATGRRARRGGTLPTAIVSSLAIALPASGHGALRPDARVGGPLVRATVLPSGPARFEEAAALFRRCREEGETVRRLMDCLIAAVAIRFGAPVLHRDADFDVLARHTELEIAR